MFAPLAPDTRFLDVYTRFYQPAKHPGDEHRETRTAYIVQIGMLEKFFQLDWWNARFNSPPRDITTAELAKDLLWWSRYARYEAAEAGDAVPPMLRCCDVTDELTVGAMNWQVERGLPRSTANSLRRHVNAVRKFAARKLHLPLPENDRFRENVSNPVAFLPDEFQRLLAEVARTRGFVGDVPAADWWLFAVLLLFNVGGRISAMRKIPTDNLDWVRGDVLVEADTQKERKDQRVSLFASTMAAGRKLRLVERGVKTLYGDWTMTTDTMRRHFSDILVRAGLYACRADVPAKLKFHALRKTLASQVAAEHGIQVASRILNHSSITVTERYIDDRYLSTASVPELIGDPLPKPPSGPPLRVYAEATA